jgi:hypothetical protein
MVNGFVRTLVETMRGAMVDPVVGEVWIYDGKRVWITGGSFWGEHGISNFWNFRYILEDGTLGESGGTYHNDLTKFHREQE